MRRTLALLLCLLLALTGCTPFTQSSAQPEQASTEAEPEQPQEEAEPAPEAQQETRQEEDTPPDTVQVSIVDTGATYTHEDGTELLSVHSQEITIAVPGKPEVEESINADLRNLLEDVEAETPTLMEAAKEEYSITLEDGAEWTPYEDTLQATVTRQDSQVLSLRFDVYQQTGGVHGYGTSFGRSYSLSTGSRLTLDFLSAQGASFRDAALEKVGELCQTEQYEGLLFPDYADNLSEVVQDNLFCLDQDGVVFWADPYLIGPYSSGTIRFCLPYSELEGLLNQNYLPES